MELLYLEEWESHIPDLESSLKSALTKTFKRLNVKVNYEVDLTLVDKETIHQLNYEYRKIDRPTDVLSFAFLEGEDPISNIKNPRILRLLGDIFIAGEVAEKQAEELGHSLKREIVFLFIHGLLHLLGYDHQNEEEAEKMYALQREIIQEVEGL